MKITEMKTCALSIPMPVREVFGKPGVKGKANPVIVQLKTDEGLDSFAVAYAFDNFQVNSLKASIDDLEEVVIGQDIFRYAETWKDLHVALRHTGQWGGYGINAISAIDAAFWILRAKQVGLPLARLLGGFRDEVPAYASDVLREFSTMDELQREASSLVDQGFRAMKMKISGGPAKKLAEQIARVKAVREAVGDEIDLLVEVHWSMNVTDAIRVGREIECCLPYWFEDPVGLHGGGVSLEDVDALAKVTNSIDAPVAAGETFSTKYDFRRLIEKQAVDIIIVDLLRCGGITEWMKIAAMAEAWNLPVASHCIHDFSAHVIAAIPNGIIVEYMPWWDIIYKEPPKVVDGCFKIPDTPGIGLDLDPEMIKKYQIA
ncbi:MAG: mandelate racemase/muconate lactonizing enzyme family protein [Deltaproteobacteria bacterium]|nr:mandelate racemase/muconate lactonizing enzyme family protein [Deltaproteobacteria bacterium]